MVWAAVRLRALPSRQARGVDAFESKKISLNILFHALELFINRANLAESGDFLATAIK